ncbi:MAG TPA: SGNH/GDSL hydrolase family protein [Polyangiaceae bacterium]|nr:SGNH/GDSL hydrolase family protein [Polyangiaceae bacterium]
MQLSLATHVVWVSFCLVFPGLAACSGAGNPASAPDSGRLPFAGSAAMSAAGGSENAGAANAAGGTASADPAAGSGSSSASGGSSVAGAGAVSNEPPGIQYFGRWDHSDPQNPSASWGPVGIRARFEGTSVAIRLSDAQNTFTYSIDGGPQQTLAASATPLRPLASGLTDGEHTLELFRRSEGGYGKTTVSGLVLDAGKNLLAPPRRPAHKLEVVGDSISAGFGDEGTGGSTPATQNGYQAYGPQLARLLDAEWSIVAHSGQGMYRNLCEALPPNAKHMPDEFLLTQHPSVPGPAWDFASWQPDVLIVTLGTNDFSDYPPGSCQAPDAEAFRGAYQGFLQLARSKYPHTEIFALGTFIATAGNPFGTCNQQVCAAVTALSDERVHCLEPSLGPEGMWLTGPGDYIGDWTHPTVAGHTKLAQKLAQVIKPIMGW